MTRLLVAFALIAAAIVALDVVLRATAGQVRRRYERWLPAYEPPADESVLGV